MPAAAEYAVPGPAQVTVAPSPISQRIAVTRAVALTMTRPALALAVTGP
ncbi:hypothetical protein [Streptomyces similanensis]